MSMKIPMPRSSIVQEVNINLIEVSAFNTRKDLEAGTEDSSLDDLAKSIAEKGLLSPIIVRSKPGERYELIAGQRRYLACRKLKWKTIPCIVRSDLSDNDATVISLIENVHRAELNPIDKANALGGLLERYKNDYKKVSKETGISVTTVRRYVSLLGLPEEIKRKVSTTEGPAKVQSLSMLAKTFKDKGEMLTAYRKISGFTQTVQLEIIKQSGGKIGKVDELVELAHMGVFKMHTCKGVYDCAFVPQWIKVINDTLNKRDDSISDARIRDIMRLLRKHISSGRKKS